MNVKKEIFNKLEDSDIYEIALNLANMHNAFFSHSVVAYDTENRKIVYYTLMQNEEDTDDSLIELYRIDANTDFKQMCQCYDCVNNEKIQDEELFHSCKIDDIYRDLQNVRTF